MKAYKYFFTLIFSLVIHHNFYSQTIPDIKSPQTYQFEKYGNIPINKNTGSNAYSINLYSFTNIYGNESFDISLNYFGTGFVPAKKSNYVGLDWSLNFGGTISRSVRGIADDFFPSPGSSSKLYGYLEGVRNCNRDNYAIYTGNYSHLPQNNVSGIGIKCGTYSYELEPDVFNFNFAGKSGYFYIGNDGFPIISSEEKGLKIDISNLSSKQPLNSFNDGSKCLTKNSVIKITDGKGISYYFGGVYDNLDISYPLESNVNVESKFTITAWNLFKIEYPNSNVIEVKYLPVTIDTNDKNFCQDRDFMQNIKEPLSLFLDQAFVYSREMHAQKSGYSSGNLIFDGTVKWGDGSSYSDSGIQPARQRASKKSLPQQITFNGTPIVTFNYERFEKYANNRLASNRMTGIQFYNQVSQKVKEVSLSYYRNQDYFFLEKLKVFRMGKLSFDYLQEYAFDYFSKDALPDDATMAIDYYGYWNNITSNRLIPNFVFDKNTAAYSFTEGIREPNTNLYATSLLKSITYPSKGKTEFIYEPHSFSEKVDRNYASQFKNTLISSSGNTGGGRLNKILNYSENGTLASTTEYKYIKNFNPNTANNISSGILSNQYRFLSYFSAQSSNMSLEQLDIYSDNILESAMNSSPVLYSEVTEVTNNHSYIKYFFTDHHTNPDDNSYKTVYNNLYDPVSYSFKPDNILNLNLPYSSNSGKRGKIYKEELYDSSFNKIKETITEYVDAATLGEWYNYATLSITRGDQKFNIRQYGNTFLPQKITVNEYFPTNMITSTAEYTYGYKPYTLNSVKTVDSDNIEIYSEFGYTNYGVVGDANMVEVPLYSSKRKNGNIISLTRTEFSKNSATNNLVMPTKSSIDDMNTNTPITQTTYDLYDSKGNLLQYTKADGTPTTVLYGYNQTLPIIKIDGAAYSDIAAKLGFPNTNDGYKNLSVVTASNIDSSTNYETQTLIPLLDQFKQNNLLSDYFISTYTYDPLIGVTSITSPSGEREVYTYDIANRLKEVKKLEKDSTGVTTYKTNKEFQYNYKQ